MPELFEGGDVAVLVSGGLDSTVMLVDLFRRFERVHPIYMRFGLHWESVELACLQRFLEAVKRSGLMPLHDFDEPMADVYGPHWSLNGANVPDAQSTDSAVYLPGRNLLLIAKAAVWCGRHGIKRLALGSLASNPFPDCTSEFFQSLELVLSCSIGVEIELLRPFEGLHKNEVIQRGKDLPLWLTLSCLDPSEGIHCGVCNKCAERRRGFLEVGLEDRTIYKVDDNASRL